MAIDLSGFTAFARRVGAVPLVPRASTGAGNTSDDRRMAETLTSPEPVPLVPRVPRRNEPEAGRERDDAFEERAAIAEYDGGLPRPHAEILAALRDLPLGPDGDALLDAVVHRLMELAAAARLR